MLHLAQRAATIGLGLVALTLLFDGTAQAQTVGAWGPRQFCTSRFGDPAPTCAYYTWEQCLATIRGTGLTCEVNPYYRAAPDRDEAPRTRRHRTH